MGVSRRGGVAVGAGAVRGARAGGAAAGRLAGAPPPAAALQPVPRLRHARHQRTPSAIAGNQTTPSLRSAASLTADSIKSSDF